MARSRRPERERQRGASRAELVASEQGTIRKQAPLEVALVYPSPYRVAMASLGYQTLYRLVNERPGSACERATLESPDETGPLVTLETGRPVSDFPLVALSVATEAEVCTAARALLAAGIEPLERARRERGGAPLVVAGGPLTYADGQPLAALADVVLSGEAEGSLDALLGVVESGASRSEVLEAAAGLDGAIVPSVSPVRRAEPALAPPTSLPAYSAVVTPRSELRDMFLVEPARGCPRRCSFCVMEPSRPRFVPADLVLSRVPDRARRVGLVGSAVGSHPELRRIVSTLVGSGREVSLSSVRADRLDAELVGLLARGGLRSLTVAADGASERLRELVCKRITAEDLLGAARLAAGAGLRSVKLYAMVGLPGETDEDLEELCGLASEMAGILPLALALSPFVPKAGTSLAGAPFAPLGLIKHRLALVRSRLGRRVDLRAASVRAAWLEQAVARGGLAAGEAAVEAARTGCSHESFRRALLAAGLG